LSKEEDQSVGRFLREVANR